ncbi:hypothetical protein FKM82_004768 [Ascaphus truei]
MHFVLSRKKVRKVFHSHRVKQPLSEEHGVKILLLCIFIPILQIPIAWRGVCVLFKITSIILTFFEGHDQTKNMKENIRNSVSLRNSRDVPLFCIQSR